MSSSLSSAHSGKFSNTLTLMNSALRKSLDFGSFSERRVRLECLANLPSPCRMVVVIDHHAAHMYQDFNGNLPVD